MQTRTVGRRSGFTLIELMVVVAIISLLAAMLLPALSRAKSKASRLACMSGVRQLNLALNMYADDSEDQYPMRAEREFSWVYKLEPYYIDYKVLRCPMDHWSDPYDYSYLINGFNDWFEANLSAADYNLFKLWMWPGGMKPAAVPQPSDTITFGEKIHDSHHVHMDFYQSLGNDIEEIDHGKHTDGSKKAGGANFAFVDGSVRVLKYWSSLAPENLWAVTPPYRAQSIPEH
jgi:prepilin-type N-terminal cleavage/methylation domain-containing protein/prepilin-type processing-associated H-X9-DG protein